MNAERKEMVIQWLEKWQVVLASGLIALASFSLGAGLNHVGELKTRAEIRLTCRQMLDVKDVRIEALAKQVGEASHKAIMAADKAGEAAVKADQAAEKASQAVSAGSDPKESR